MSKISKELIENYKKIVLPYVSNQLYKANFEGQGETDKTEFEQDFNKILDLAIKALEEERPQGDLISREALKEAIDIFHQRTSLDEISINALYRLIDDAPTVEEIEKNVYY